MVAIAAAVGPATAQERPSVVASLLKAGGGSGDDTGSKSYGPTTLNPAQLKDCFVLAHQIDETSVGMDARLTAIQAEEAELATLQAQIERGNRQGFSSQSDRGVHNQRIGTFNTRVGEYRKQVQAFNDAQEPQKERMTRFNDRCGGRGFYASDLPGIRGQLPFDLGRYQ